MTKDEAISTERALDLAQGYLDGLIRSLNMDDTSEAVQVRDAIKQARSAPVQSAERGEPVGYVAENGVVDWNVCAPPILTDLYTTPPAQPAPVQDIDWKNMYEKEKRRSEMWLAKYEKDIGPLEYAVPVAAPVQDVSLIDEGKTAAQTAPVQGPSIRFNTAEAMDKAKADRDKPVTPVEYIPAISDVGSDSNMVCPDTMYGLLPKGTGKITLHESKPAPVQPVAFEDWHSANYVQTLEKYGDSYKNMHVRNRWQGWLGAKSTPPAARGKWVGLTPEKIDELMYRFTGYELLYAIEAELKENNT
jgi:hypothetical protein